MAHDKSRNSFKPHTRNKKNPYSDRGLDKFSALLANLQQKRNQIYSQNDPENIVLVRFAHKSSGECVPLVVKQRNKTQDKQLVITESEPIQQNGTKSETNSRGLRKPKLSYVSAVVILVLILFLLCVFSRFMAVLWVCVVWYLVPVLKQSSLKLRKCEEV